MSGSGFDVTSEELDAYADKLGGQRGTAKEIGGLVDQADVGDESWGIVGIFTLNTYREMLGDLKDLFQSVDEGFQSGEEKFRSASNDYVEAERQIKELLDTFNIEIENK